MIVNSIKEPRDAGMAWRSEDDDSRFGRSRPAAPDVPDIPTPVDATSICDEIKKMYVYMREKGFMHEARALYDPLGECLDMFYVDKYFWKLKEQSDNYAEAMTRVKECLKKGYAACQTQKRVYVYVPYDTYATFVDICHMCGRYVHDIEMTQYVKTTRERYTDRQTKERPIIELEDKLEDAEVWRDAYKRYYQQVHDENRELQEQIRSQKFNRGWRERRSDDVEVENTIRELSEEVARFKTEIQVLERKHSKEVARLKTEIEVLEGKRSEEVVSHTPQPNTDSKPPQTDSADQPTRSWFSRFRRHSQCSPVTILLADLRHFSDREHFEGPFIY